MKRPSYLDERGPLTPGRTSKPLLVLGTRFDGRVIRFVELVPGPAAAAFAASAAAGASPIGVCLGGRIEPRMWLLLLLLPGGGV